MVRQGVPHVATALEQHRHSDRLEGIVAELGEEGQRMAEQPLRASGLLGLRLVACHEGAARTVQRGLDLDAPRDAARGAVGDAATAALRPGEMKQEIVMRLRGEL